MKSELNIIVTGANGQLGMEFRELFESSADHKTFFFDRADWDICDEKFSEYIFENYRPDVLINCAAYTNVDGAEKDRDTCFEVNAKSLKHLSALCVKYGSSLIHYSTDYVFDGKQTQPYSESDECHPLNVYGESKLEGENIIRSSGCKHFIIRSSWLYSHYGKNFLKTMIRLGNQHEEITVIDDQISSPTNCSFLAKITQTLIERINDFQSGVYHYSHEGECSWNEYASHIFKYLNINCKVKAIKTEEYKASADRPRYSKLDSDKIHNALGREKISWKEALNNCLNKIETEND